jgi:hypothetical protein
MNPNNYVSHNYIDNSIAPPVGRGWGGFVLTSPKIPLLKEREFEL